MSCLHRVRKSMIQERQEQGLHQKAGTAYLIRKIERRVRILKIFDKH